MHDATAWVTGMLIALALMFILYVAVRVREEFELRDGKIYQLEFQLNAAKETPLMWEVDLMTVVESRRDAVDELARTECRLHASERARDYMRQLQEAQLDYIVQLEQTLTPKQREKLRAKIEATLGDMTDVVLTKVHLDLADLSQAPSA